MGLAASQARLLSITSRMSDNELRSQLINNQKIRLASESSTVSDDYVTALNGAQMMFANYDADNNKSYQNLTFNNLTAYNPYNNQYGLSNQNGSILVSETDALNFQNSGNPASLENFLKAYGLENTTTYFGDAMLAKYVGDDDCVYLPSVDLNGNNIKISTGYTPEDLRAIYEGAIFNNGVASDGLTHIGYEACINSPEFIAYDSATSDFSNKIEFLKNVADPAINQYIKSLSFSGISISSNNANDIRTKLEELAEQTPSKSNYDTACSYLGLPRTNPSSGLIAIMEELQKKLGGATGSDSYRYYTEFIDAIENWDISTSTENVDTTTTPGITYLAMPEFNAEPDRTSVDYFIGVDTEGIASIYKFDESGNPISAPEAFNWQTITDTDGTTYSEKYALSTTIDADGKHYTLTTSEQDADGNTTAETQDYLWDTISNDKINVLASYEGYDLTYMTNFVDSLLNQYYLTYEDYIDYTSLLTPAQVQLLNSGGTPELSQTVFNESTLTETKTETKTYANALDAYMESGKVLSEVVFGAGQDVGKENYAHLLDIDWIKNEAPKSGFNYLNTNAGFQNVVDYTTLENVFNVYGEPEYSWIDTTNSDEDGNSKKNWYANLFNRMSSGYQVVQDGLASSKEWIKFALESGLVSMEQVDDGSTWNSFTYTCCSDITEQTDSAAVTVAEAEYNQKMNKIKAKDQRFDLELKNIDTEHNALQTEYESIKSVIDKNVERTFKIYS